MSQAKWHYSVNGQSFGPMTQEDILAKVSAGQAQATDYVWCDGMGDWQPMNAVAEFQAALAAAAPAPAAAVAPVVAEPAAPAVADDPAAALAAAAAGTAPAAAAPAAAAVEDPAAALAAASQAVAKPVAEPAPAVAPVVQAEPAPVAPVAQAEPAPVASVAAPVAAAVVPEAAPAQAAPAPAASGAATAPVQCHDVDYEIFGDDLQVVEVELDPGEVVIAEAGVMNYMDDGITFEARFGDGSKPDQGFFGKLMEAGKRKLTGESLFLTHFTNASTGKRRVAFAAPYPGKIVALDLGRLGGEALCQKDVFLCAAMGTEIGIAFTKRIGTGLFGGEGFILQRLRGDGLAFVHAGGTIIKRKLAGEKILVDTGCLVAFTPGINYSIERAGNLKSMIFGGEGLFLATLQGTGTVWLQTLPFSRLAGRVLSAAAGSKGEGSVLGGIAKAFES